MAENDALLSGNDACFPLRLTSPLGYKHPVTHTTPPMALADLALPEGCSCWRVPVVFSPWLGRLTRPTQQPPLIRQPQP
jgi:hypothetical protein